MPWDSQASLHSETGKPHVPPIVELTHEYDKASNRLNRFDETPTHDWDHRHQEYEYDGLHRLKEARRGVRDGSFTHPSEQASRQWDLDTLGNWRELLEWDTSSYATAEEREHTDANELTARTIGMDELELTYDKTGNLTEQDLTASSSVTYIYDAWNRLVRVKYGSSDRAKYRYNGLNWRIEKHADTSMPPDGDLNQRREMYYSANWQLLEERIDDDALAQEPEIDRHMQYVWGPRYIDDIVARRQNSDFENDDPDVTYEDVWYHLTDAQFSTVAVIDENAMVIERISYDAYGRARHHRGADLNGDGDVDTFDLLDLLGNWGEYGMGDVDRNGIVNVYDQLDLQAMYGAALEPGQLSITDNIIGYAGYVFNAEHHGGGTYHVRHRVLEVDLGRWLTRDPYGTTLSVLDPLSMDSTSFLRDGAASGDEHDEYLLPWLQYSDGMNIYEYVQSRPLLYSDPSGLFGGGIRWLFSSNSCEKKIRKKWKQKWREDHERKVRGAGGGARDRASGGFHGRWLYCVTDAAWKANNRSKRISFPGGGGSKPIHGAVDGPRDALRHCIWACEIARRCNSSDLAREITTAHEICAEDGIDGKDDSSRMDLCNNAVGISIAEENKDCVEGCQDALRLGKLCVLCPNR